MAMNLNAKWKEKEAARKSKVVFMGKYQGVFPPRFTFKLLECCYLLAFHVA